MQSSSLIHVCAVLVLFLGCQSSRSRPPSDVDAVRQPTIWDHLFSDREDEREAIAARLRAEEGSLRGRKAGLMRSLREHELEAQLSSDHRDRSKHQASIASLTSEIDTAETELDWVAARQQQNQYDRRHWPDRNAYRKPAMPATDPIVETPARNDVSSSSHR